MKPMKKGAHEPEKLVLRLVDTNGNEFSFEYTHSAQMDFDDAQKINAANTWRRQTLRRRLGVSIMEAPEQHVELIYSL